MNLSAACCARAILLAAPNRGIRLLEIFPAAPRRQYPAAGFRRRPRMSPTASKASRKIFMRRKSDPFHRTSTTARPAGPGGPRRRGCARSAGRPDPVPAAHRRPWLPADIVRSSVTVPAPIGSRRGRSARHYDQPAPLVLSASIALVRRDKTPPAPRPRPPRCRPASEGRVDQVRCGAAPRVGEQVSPRCHSSSSCGPSRKCTELHAAGVHWSDEPGTPDVTDMGVPRHSGLVLFGGTSDIRRRLPWSSCRAASSPMTWRAWPRSTPTGRHVGGGERLLRRGSHTRGSGSGLAGAVLRGRSSRVRVDLPRAWPSGRPSSSTSPPTISTVEFDRISRWASSG